MFTGLSASANAGAPPPRASGGALVIDAAIALLTIVPLLLTAHLPLADLPNHMATLYVVNDWAHSTALQTFYQIRWGLIPNLALEIFVLAAHRFMSIDMAVRAFCIATMLLLLSGTRLLNRQLSGGRSHAYRIAPLLCYGGPFQYGFLSYCFGIGLALLFLGLYLRWRLQPFARLALWLVPAGFVLMLCHMMAFGCFALAVGACELSLGFAAAATPRQLPGAVLRCVIRPVACLVPVFLLFHWLGPSHEYMAASDTVVFSTPHQKLRSLASITLFASPRIELGLLVLAVAGLAAALVMRTVRVQLVGVAVVLLLAVVWLLLPDIAMGGAFIDYRLPWAIAFFLLAALVPGPQRRQPGLLAAWFTALVVARVTTIAVLWLLWEPTLNALDHALGQLPEGARLMVIEGQRSDGGVFRQPTLTYVSTYAVSRRHVFDPALFANMPGQLVYFQPHYRDLWQQDSLGESPHALNVLPPDYDYVLVLLPETAKLSPGLHLSCAAKGPHFSLLKVVPPGQSASTPACPA